MKRLLGAALIVSAAFAMASCGDSSDGGRATLNMWVFQEPSGSFTDAAKRCGDASNGRYKVVFNALSNSADQQRQSLVARLAAKDSSIDILGMDVVWTAEFAEAEWIKPWPEPYASELKEGTLDGPLQTATYKGRIYAAPANTNTQLLWYRKDLVSDPATTWDALIDQASKLPKGGRIVTMGAQYEGSMVWFNSLVQSAGGTIVTGEEASLGEPAQRAAEIMHKLATSKVGDPGLSAMKEDQVRIAFETGNAAFEVNWPFIYPSARDGAPAIFKNLAWAPYPGVDADKPAKAPIGGINWGVGNYSEHPKEAFEAAACLRNEENQRQAAIKGGLPPTLASLYDDTDFVKQYPMADLIRKQVDSAAVRPQTPAYADVSLAIAKTVSPASSISLGGFVDDLEQKINDALDSKGLI